MVTKILAAPRHLRTTVADAPIILWSLLQQRRVLQTLLSDGNYVGFALSVGCAPPLQPAPSKATPVTPPRPQSSSAQPPPPPLATDVKGATNDTNWQSLFDGKPSKAASQISQAAEIGRERDDRPEQGVMTGINLPTAPGNDEL
jgi:hypothetical protein